MALRQGPFTTSDPHHPLMPSTWCLMPLSPFVKWGGEPLVIKHLCPGRWVRVRVRRVRSALLGRVLSKDKESFVLFFMNIYGSSTVLGTFKYRGSLNSQSNLRKKAFSPGVKDEENLRM